jgi:hypothetical protein
MKCQSLGYRIPFLLSFANNRFYPRLIISMLHQRFLFSHLLTLHLTLYNAFSSSVHHNIVASIAEKSGLISLPNYPYRYFTVATPTAVSSYLELA